MSKSKGVKATISASGFSLTIEGLSQFDTIAGAFGWAPPTAGRSDSAVFLWQANRSRLRLPPPFETMSRQEPGPKKMSEEAQKSSYLSHIKARIWAFASLLAVLFASITRKRRSDRHSSPPLP